MNENIANKRMPKDGKLYHVDLCQNDLGGAEIAILPGDPGRVLYLAKMLDSSPKKLSVHREYTSYLVNIRQKKILIISTGMGGPSVGIAVEELAMTGIKKYIRVGTTGTIQEKIQLGDLILSTGAVRLDGTSLHYAPLEYPALSDIELNISLINAAKNLLISMHYGITASSDTFFPGQERYDNYSGFVRKHFKGSVDEWRSLNVMNFEMEASALFTICSVFGLKSACICAVIAKRTHSEHVDKSQYDESMRKIMNIIKHAIECN